jgi:hypothetical protein
VSAPLHDLLEFVEQLAVGCTDEVAASTVAAAAGGDEPLLTDALYETIRASLIEYGGFGYPPNRAEAILRLAQAGCRA